MTDRQNVVKSAIITPDHIYRLSLERSWNRAGDTVLFVMLNPSTADALTDDPTIRRCVGFARKWGFGRLVVLNAYAYRATRPSDLFAAAAQGVDIVGPGNDELLRRSEPLVPVVCAWGQNIKPKRSTDVISLLRHRGAPVLCFGKTRTGQPKHPLYLRGDIRFTDLEAMR